MKGGSSKEGHRLIRLFSLPLAAVSTSVFIVAILILLLLLYHRDPMCCQFLCSCRFFQTPSQYVSVLPPARPPPALSFLCAGVFEAASLCSPPAAWLASLMDLGAPSKARLCLLLVPTLP